MTDELQGPVTFIPADRRANAATRRQLSRRTFIGASLTVAGGAGVGTLIASSATAAPRTSASDPYPFTLGVASGEPTSTGIVLWTRLAIDPIAEDGSGGMPQRAFEVQWELAADPRFSRVVQRGTTAAEPRWGHSVHLEVDGLEPAREYWYRFRAFGHVSPTARTRTLPPPNSDEPCRAITVSCSHYEGGYFEAYRHAAEERPDVVLALGDYIYEGAGVAGRFRVHPGSTCLTLGDYRRRHALYKAEPQTQQLHHTAPWLVTWDDHEIQDNWAGLYPRDGVPTDAWRLRRAAAIQAYWENMPLRPSALRPDGELQLFRRFDWGRTATFHVLDTRQYRDLQAHNDGGRTWWFADGPVQADPSRTILGDRQESWLLNGFQGRADAWHLMAQGVFFAKRDNTAGPQTIVGSDGWDGYQADRNTLVQGWQDAGVDNAVVLTGDVHLHFANELKADFRDPDSATVGVELVTTSVSTNGDGSDTVNGGPTVLAENPHIKYIQNRRGYVSMSITKHELTADFKVLQYVTRLNQPISTGRRYVVPAGAPQLIPA
ncbi:alkaline phosphatase D [Kribbella steppae]|uniref:Alkaline phosphatase D n=1 Tax=Kribbella steppae TaxID=2512223 RepID=A0A4R2H9Z1_9ACTN|nr:alkaline phosphatase D family protein [Kribbella steppae]TCO23505.1 alkaline phosphatase D [Kribbella steppae]